MLQPCPPALGFVPGYSMFKEHTHGPFYPMKWNSIELSLGAPCSELGLLAQCM